MKLLAIILNHKTRAMTMDSLRTLMVELVRFPDTRVTIVDNDSQDGSFEALCEAVGSMDDRAEGQVETNSDLLVRFTSTLFHEESRPPLSLGRQPCAYRWRGALSSAPSLIEASE